MKNSIYIFEGLPGSGKTSICKHLASHGFKTVPEIIYNKNQIKNQFYFLKSEELKMARALKLNTRGHKVVMDRSFVSVLAFNYARDKLFGYKSYPKALERMGAFALNEGLKNKLFFIYMQSPVSVAFDRKRRKRKLNFIERKFWLNENFLSEMEKYSLHYLKTNFPKRHFVLENRGTYRQILLEATEAVHNH